MQLKTRNQSCLPIKLSETTQNINHLHLWKAVFFSFFFLLGEKLINVIVWWPKCRPSHKMKLKFTWRETQALDSYGSRLGKQMPGCLVKVFEPQKQKKKKTPFSQIYHKSSVHTSCPAMSEHSRETDGKFSCCFVNVVCDWECQRGYLASTASERSSSPLWCDVRARSKNDPGVRDGWQTSRRGESARSRKLTEHYLPRTVCFLAVSCWCTAFVSLATSGRTGSDPA